MVCPDQTDIEIVSFSDSDPLFFFFGKVAYI